MVWRPMRGMITPMVISPEHHRASIRLQSYDYRNGGTYFVTICTKNKEQILGEVRNGFIGLSEIGCIVADELQKTPVIRPYVHLDRWCIMPNHIHVIFQIDEHIEPHVGAPCHGAPTDERRWQSQSLGSIIGQLKIVTTKRIRKVYPKFSWQRNYYEHIIRDTEERIRIRDYIRNNPITWNIDPENIP